MKSNPRSLIRWRDQGGQSRAYADLRSLGGGQPALIPPGETRATTDPEIAEILFDKLVRKFIAQAKKKALHALGSGPDLTDFAGHYSAEMAASDDYDADELRELDACLVRVVDYFTRWQHASARQPEPLQRRRPLALIGIPDIYAFNEWLNSMPDQEGNQLTAESRRTHLYVLSGVFDTAIAKGKLPMGSNPVAGLIRDIGRRSRETEWLSVGELALLLESARTLMCEAQAPGAVRPLPCLYELVATFMLTGAREGEITRLQVRHLDFGSRTIHIPDSKTGRVARSIPMHSQLREILWPYVQSLGRTTGHVFTTTLSEPIALLLDAAGHLRTLPAPPAAGGLRAHLAAAHVRLDQQRCALVEAVQRIADLPDVDPIRQLRANVTSYSRSADAYRRWVDFGRSVETLRRTRKYEGSTLEAEDLLSRAREILSVDGLVALDQVALLELDLAKLEAKASDRSSHVEASTRLAAERLGSELATLFDSPDPGPLAYTDSLECLQVTVAQRVHRGVSALRLRAACSDLDARTRAGLLSRLDRILESVRSNGNGLFAAQGDRLARTLVEQIRQARNALDAHGSSHRIGELSRSLTAGPVDLVSALDGGKEPETNEWLREVMRLARAGLIRVTMDVPQQDLEAASGDRDAASLSAAPAVQ